MGTYKRRINTRLRVTHNTFNKEQHMLYNIANNKDRAIFTILVLLVALFSTKAQAEYTFNSSDKTARGTIYSIGGSYTTVECPAEIEPLLRAHSRYYIMYGKFQDVTTDTSDTITNLGVSNLLDSEIPKLKKLNEGLNKKIIEGFEEAVVKTRNMLQDGCAKDSESKCSEGGRCEYTVKTPPIELIKRAEHYLK